MDTILRPLRDRVIVRRPIKYQDKEGSFFIPMQARRRTSEAVVVAVGSGVDSQGYHRTMILNPGDRVLVGRFSGMGTHFKVGQVEYFLLREEQDIYAVIGEEVQVG